MLLGKALLQKGTFSTLNSVTAVDVKVQSAVPTTTVISLLELLGLELSTAVYGLSIDSFEYYVTTPA